MESQNSLEIEWSTHEVMPKEEEVFSFQHQLPPLDFRYQEIGCSNYDLDATYLMDTISKAPIRSSMDILPDSSLLYEGGFLVGRDGELGFPDHELPTMMDPLSFSYQEMYTMNSLSFPNQEMSTMNTLSFPIQEMNSLSFPNQEMSTMNTLSFPIQEMNSLSFPSQEMNSLGFPNQEMYMMNTSGFSYQTQPVIMATENVQEKEEKKIVKSGCEQSRERLVQKDDNGNGDGGNCELNHPLRMALSKEMISQYFYMPIRDAAEELNVGITLLKKRCRELGIRRWPHRKLMSLQTLITNVQQDLGKSSENGAEEKLQEAIMRLENERRKMEEIPDLQLEDHTKKLRQARFKANYKKRKTIGTRSLKNSPTLTTYSQSSSSCSNTCVDHGGYEVMEYGYGGFMKKTKT